MRETKSTCPYCGVGCGVIIETQGAQITGVRGDPDHPANFGRLCTKGSTLHLTASAVLTQQTRLLQPMRRLQRGAAPQALGWDTALDLAADKFAHIINQHGPDAVGFYISGQLLTEDYYVFNKLAKGLIGTNNIDSNSRLCMSSAVAGYKQTLGMDAPPTCYDDVNHAGTIFIVGSNTAYAHPILFRRIEDARRANPALKIVVCDPRRTDTAEIADLFLPIQPGTDVMLFNGMLHLMLWEGWLDAAFIAAHTQGFEALKATVRDCTPEVVAHTCGISKEDLFTAARLFAGVQDTDPLPESLQSSELAKLSSGLQDISISKRVRTPTLSLYCQGLNQSSSGTAKNAALINLHLATGQIGKPGAGPFSLTGQPNAMGGREVGGMANLLSAHRDLGNAAHRAEVAALWGVADVPAKPGKTAVELFQAAADGEIKALWIACTNPAQSMPDQATVRRALERAEFVLVQEAFASTATCRYADLLLPATTWGEKEGTVTNSERRISRVRAAIPAPAESRHDWQIAVDFAQRLEPRLIMPSKQAVNPSPDSQAFCHSPDSQALSPSPSKQALGVRSEFRTTPSTEPKNPERNSALTPNASPPQKTQPPKTSQPKKSIFNYPTPESIWQEHRESTRGRDLDITGLTYAILEKSPQQWPFKEGQKQGQARLYENHQFPTPTGKANFINTPYKPVAEPRESRYPFSLTTGRLRDQWHGMSRTGTLGRLFGHVKEPALQMNPQDMARRLLKDGDLVHVTSKRGSILVPVQASTEMGLSQVFMAMHWGEEFLSGVRATGQHLAGVNALTTSAYCPDSKQPEFKHAAVKVLKADSPWQLLAVAWLPESLVASARIELQQLMARFDFASCVPFSNNKPLNAADEERHGLLFRASHSEAAPDELLAKIEALLNLDNPFVVRYADKKRGQRRAALLQRGDTQTTLEGFLLAGDTSAQDWITTLLKDELPAQAYGRALLLPGVKPPVAVVSRGQTVCACFNVTDVAIEAHLKQCPGNAQERLSSLQTALKCGTNCGSCVPQLQRMVKRSLEEETLERA